MHAADIVQCEEFPEEISFPTQFNLLVNEVQFNCDEKIIRQARRSRLDLLENLFPVKRGEGIEYPGKRIEQRICIGSALDDSMGCSIFKVQ